MRLFVALDLPEALLGSLSALLTQLRPLARLSWSSAANLHVTTKFIGDWPEKRLGELVGALRAMPRRGPLMVELNGLGWLPNPHSPRMFWAAVKSEALKALAQATAEATSALGVASETRDFHPHLTLARIKDRVDLAPLRLGVARLESVAFGEFEARSQFLYLSKNSVYTKLEEFPL